MENAHGYQRITDLSAATALTLPTGGPKLALIQAEVAPIRWRDDGTNPTASTGMRIEIGQELRYDADLTRIRLIQESAGAIASVSYYGST